MYELCSDVKLPYIKCLNKTLFQTSFSNKNKIKQCPNVYIQLSNKYGITFAIHNVRAHVKHSTTLNYFVQTLQTELYFLSTINVFKN